MLAKQLVIVAVTAVFLIETPDLMSVSDTDLQPSTVSS